MPQMFQYSLQNMDIWNKHKIEAIDEMNHTDNLIMVKIHFSFAPLFFINNANPPFSPLNFQ